MRAPAVQEGQTYRHWKKGDRYAIVCLATDSETDAPMVVYRAIETGRNFVRSMEMFLSPKVTETGESFQRFQLENDNGGQEASQKV